MHCLSQSNSISRFNMRCARLAFVLPVILLVAGSAARAQVSGESGLWVHGIDFKKPPEETLVFVSAVSSNWRAGEEPIMGYTPLTLTPDKFSVFIDNKSVGAIQVKSFGQSQVGLDLVLAIDVSGSVYPNFEFVKRGVSAYVEQRRQGKDQIAILLFGNGVKTSQFGSDGKYTPFSGDIESLNQFISAPPAELKSQTFLFRAAAYGVEIAARGRHDSGGVRVQKALFVFSDGHEESTGFDIDVPIKLAKESRIQIFCVGLPEAATRNAHHDKLRKIASETGGVFLTVNDLSSIQKVFERLDFLIKNEHVLSFALPLEFADGNEHTLQIQAKNRTASLEKVIRVRTPFIPPTPPPPPINPLLVILLLLAVIVIVFLFVWVKRYVAMESARKQHKG